MNLLVNAISAMASRMQAAFPHMSMGTKRNHYKDFGYPDSVTFRDLYRAYNRHSIARAAVKKITTKTWEKFPELWETPKPSKTDEEKLITERFEDIGLWRALADADRRAIVGGYAGVILRLADGRTFDKPVTFVPNGLDGLIEAIPVWKSQLTVSKWVDDINDPNYGKPAMFEFDEQAVNTTKSAARKVSVHPDRVLIWSADGTIHCGSDLEAGYNDLIDMEKVRGAGGEGFWKNAKSAPVLEMDKEVKIADMASAMGVKPDEIADVMNDQVEKYQKGFDELLLLKGMQAKTLNVQLPNPEHFYNIPLMSFAASMCVPSKILLGNQIGERASSEDGREFAATCNSRRNEMVIPRIRELVQRLVKWGVLSDKRWIIGWPSLTEETPTQRVERGYKMASTNRMQEHNPVYSVDEIREETGYDAVGNNELVPAPAKPAPTVPTDEQDKPEEGGGDVSSSN